MIFIWQEKGGDMLQRNRMILALAILLTFCALAIAEVQLTALQLPEGKSLNVKFVRTNRAPAKAAMKASLKFERGQASINLSYKKMEPAVLFGGDISAYVLWAVTADSVVENLGEVLIDRKNCSGSQEFSTGKKIFALMVTAEPVVVANRPTELAIFTSGGVKPKQAINTPFKFANFETWPKPALETIAGTQYNDKTPVAIRQAQNVLNLAEKMNAAEVNPSAMKDAKTAFTQANNTAKLGGSKTVVIDYARRAIDLASQAIRDTIRTDEAKTAAEIEAKRRLEKAALEQRASEAETESQRISRELKEVQAQRAALAQESKELALQAKRLAAERDELSRMLRDALSTVAETNETARGVIVSLPGILFDLNKATLKAPAQLTLAKLAGILMVFQKMNLNIEGHTDSTGTDEINMKLSTERAKAVYEFLWSQGISQSRMMYRGFGSAHPVVPNDTAANRARNRRVEVVLIQTPKNK